MKQMKNGIRFSWQMAVKYYAEPNIVYKGFLYHLSTYMDAKGESCFPSYDELQETGGMGRTTVAKYLKKAKKEQWLKCRLSEKKGKGWRNNEYKAWFPDDVIQKLHKEHGIIVSNDTEKVGQLNLMARVESNGSSPRELPSARQFTSRTHGSSHRELKAVHLANSIVSTNFINHSGKFFSNEKKNVDNFSKPVNYNPRGFPIT